MQPEQPTPNSQPDTPPVQQPHRPLSSAEFASLYATPAPAPLPPRSRTALSNIVPIALILLIGSATLGIGVFALTNYTSGGIGFGFTPAVGATVSEENAQKLFAGAIENHLSTPYITQNYTREVALGDDAPVTARIQATSDFSNPKLPLTTLRYTVTATESADDYSILNRNQIMLNTRLFSRIPEDTSAPDTVYTPGMWYELSESTSADDRFVLDTFGIAKGVNTPFGEILVGNFSKSDRKALLNHMTENQTYTLSKPIVELVDDIKALRVSITADSARINSLNELAAEKLRENQTFADSASGKTDTVTMDAWIDYSTKRFKKIVMVHTETGASETATLLFDYPASIPEIIAPLNAKRI